MLYKFKYFSSFFFNICRIFNPIHGALFSPTELSGQYILQNFDSTKNHSSQRFTEYSIPYMVHYFLQQNCLENIFYKKIDSFKQKNSFDLTVLLFPQQNNKENISNDFSNKKNLFEIT